MNWRALLLAFPYDSGPVYQETMAGRLPVEPFNTYSNILFLCIVIYYSLKVYKDYNNHRFLAWSIPVLFLGFIGGTVYHATRSHDIWMYMDWLPIVLLCLAVSVYYTIKLKMTRKSRTTLILVVLFLVFGIRMLPLPRGLETSIGYIATAIGLLLPLVTYFYTTKLHNWGYVLLAFLSFGFAIGFRILDGFYYIIPMGTHWLWHVFGALSVFFLIKYIYKDKLPVQQAGLEIKPNKPLKEEV
ncbi:ceramidase [Christiangramia sabulilitoris]|uniref:Ceramidase n=1 Tax=Christiangramia sabulilitoris TaxID=2583991 RepID=A0A550I937_9FLAO|nr:ceramidase [Christiangramia sabulilitoris]TRO67485.1 ceramidase [Christiangramia sabulilitoris]